MTTSEHWSPPEQGEDEDYLDYLARKVDLYHNDPPSAPPGFELVECSAEPRHWPMYTIADDDFVEGPCPYCMSDGYQAELRVMKHRYHWFRHPVRGRLASRFVGKLYVLGVIAGRGSAWGGDDGCNWCITVRVRGKRPYVLGWPDWKWACLLKRRHWPGEYVGLGMCGKCLPCPDCGATDVEHECRGVA
ncbi:hypothetical protein IU451_29090 [Nocardia cyriacigeorgica]|uniref:hypothetical protein n=1 Tax=Nocardia cyriacigeorgica TaxID=135487 RepID=UPI0018937517|nr:hypothetical protein [Nocardia cyriacigeorgica]MBF6326560.1 hypothetical protein [Nocardia cyriacigeorgica]